MSWAASLKLPNEFQFDTRCESLPTQIDFRLQPKLSFGVYALEFGIARNILSKRLAKLVEHGILDRQPCADDRRRIEYRLTPKGFDLLPAMVSLRQWGQKYGGEFVEDPVLVDELDRLPIGPVSILSHDGRVLNGKDLRFVQRSNLGVREDGTVARPARGFDRAMGDDAPAHMPHIAAAR
jgi:DNA-binding HxlR family transcriptional regulator